MIDQKKVKALFTILYPFMSEVLNLAGLAKECFAVIFGFWLAQGERPISASISIMQAITGGTRPAIVTAIRHLKEEGFIQAKTIPGKRTLYQVSIDRKIIDDFKAMYPNTLPVKHVNPHELTLKNSTRKETKPHNINKPKLESYYTPLKVRTNKDIYTGYLKEV